MAPRRTGFYAASMVTRIGKNTRRRHLYITEWMEARGLSDEKIGARLDVARETVFRWRKEQHRLNPEKIAALAEALDVDPAELWRLPATRKSVDALLSGASDDLHETVFSLAERLTRKHG